MCFGYGIWKWASRKSILFNVRSYSVSRDILFCVHTNLNPVLDSRVATMVNNNFNTILIFSLFIINQSYINADICDGNRVEERHGYRCWVPNVASAMRGTTYQQCIMACRTRKDCGFLNFNSAEGQCQLGNFCLEMQPAPGVETVAFGEFYHNDCVQWIPLNVVGGTKVKWRSSDLYVSRLMTDTYAMPGSTNLIELKIPYYDGSSDPIVVTTTRYEDISYLSNPGGCTYKWSVFKPGKMPLPKITVLGGYVFMEDGKPDALYVVHVNPDGFGYYNPRTLKTFYLCANGTSVCVTSDGIRILRAFRKSYPWYKALESEKNTWL